VTVKFLDLQKQYADLQNEMDSAVKKVFIKGDYIKGSAVLEFETAFADYCGVKHCISCGNGTDGLTLLIKALDLPSGSSVIVPANTFIATAEAVVNNGLNVIFADVDDDYTLSPKSVEALMGPHVSAVIAVHLYGQPAKMKELSNICKKYGAFLLEDAAQAHGAELEGVKTGNLGDAAVFSFYPGKVLGAAGDAGAVVTNDSSLAEKVSLLSNHGRTEKYLHHIPGFNSRMDTLQAAVLNVKLKYLDEWIEKRNLVASIYLENLKDVEKIILPPQRTETKHAWHLFVIRTKARDGLASYLNEKEIEYGIHYPLTLPEQPAFSSHHSSCFSFKAVSFSPEIISLPMGEHLDKKDAEYVTGAIKRFFK
jgi:dTDP-4-amino-4,6-dideoxygalactose transaminase